MFKRNPQFIVHLNNESGIPPISIFDKKFIVGRKPTHLVAIPDNSISRDHLEVVFQDGEIYIIDLGTSNGTYLDGHRIHSNAPVAYHEGQVITLGHSTVSMSIELFSEDREKRRNNASVRVMQQSTLSAYKPTATAPSYENQARSASPIQTVPANPPVSQASSEPFPQIIPDQPVRGNPAAFTPSSAPAGLSEAQLREESNRLLAKAKIDAEMAAREILRSKESEGQLLLQKAQDQAQDSLKQAESQVQVILQQAHLEGEKAKESILEEGRREKERIIASISNEKLRLETEIESIKQSQAQWNEQSNQIRLQIQKLQTEKVSAEAQLTQEQIRLEKLHGEMKTMELKLTTIQQQVELNQIKAKDAEDKHKATVLSTQSLIDDTKLSNEKAKAREAELEALIEGAKSEKEAALEFAKTEREAAKEFSKAEREVAQEFSKAHRNEAELYALKTKNEIEAYSKALKEDADGYSIKQRSDADQYAKNQRADADSYSKVTREETDRWAATTREATDLEVRKKLETLHQESTQLVAERERQYQDLKQRQDMVLEELKKAEEAKLKNLNEIDSILQKKSDDFEVAFRARRESLENEFQSRQTKLDKEHNDKRDTLEKELTDRRTTIERELLNRREELERESAEKKATIEKEAQALRSARDQEFKSMKTQQDAYLLDLKKREEDRLRAMAEESRNVIRGQFKAKSAYIEKSFAEFFKESMETGSPAQKEYLPHLEAQLGKMLKEAINNELTGEDKQIRQLLDYDPNIENKHKKFWIRFAGITATVIGLLVYLLYNPNKLSETAQSVTDSVNSIDMENKKKQAAVLEQFKQAGIYKPEKTTGFKESYTDNVLYTDRFVDFEKDDQYRSQWIVAIKEFLMKDGKLMDDKADELITKEGSLVIWLESEISTIDGRNPQIGIKRMRDREDQFIQLLTQSMNDETKRAFFEKKQAFYERYINDPSKVRGPAQEK